MDYKTLYSDYLREGCIKIENFLTPEEVEELNSGVADVLKNVPDEETYTFSVYGTGNTRGGDEYYAQSGDKVRYFFESVALNPDGKFIIDKRGALNKVGYALHWWHPIFKKYTFSQKVKDLLRNFQYQDPVVVQSMLIFKEPKIGEIVKPHQDSSFLYTEPLSCIGLWFALEDATLENGCLWYVPGSHKDKIHARFVRNPDKSPESPLFVLQGKPKDYKDEEYVAVPAKKGDCVVIHGSVMHKSEINTTKKARTCYTYHAVEKSSKWSDLNWLQPTTTLPFPSVYDN